MGTVTEVLALIGSDEPLRVVERDEELLLAPPHSSRLPMELWSDHEPLRVVHHPQEYVAEAFAAPRCVYENDGLRVEWQKMNGRQPFYHRNCDVDEIGYQIAGERTLMTELGVVEHRPGEFSRIPRGVGHDNHGRGESHLLFYAPAPVAEPAEAVRMSEAVFPPFPGWVAKPANEAVTQCMGGPGHDVVVFPVDERLLLDRVHVERERMRVFAKATTPGVTWLYGSGSFRLGSVLLPPSDGRAYRRTLDADEVQYQVSGRRTLVSQRGVVELGPGDFVRVPLGVAHTSFSTGPTEHLVVLADRELVQVGETARTARPCTPSLCAELRG
ncbi:hypothetical protein [Umezawaea sp. Da 62-37]|uniref:cupin domain-containing protein n=1 Tax=Umezawaea sp. Da 62-37 TaxID=3075927 RepID=UPI0028F6D5B9|nr:hypothetical protein [Umezawaea sp. Da 62-37]WNV88948.1 hypothetical protein RM788_11790 [Umezawaea sp. Da 62-37]